MKRFLPILLGLLAFCGSARATQPTVWDFWVLASADGDSVGTEAEEAPLSLMEQAIAQARGDSTLQQEEEDPLAGINFDAGKYPEWLGRMTNTGEFSLRSNLQSLDADAKLLTVSQWGDQNRVNSELSKGRKDYRQQDRESETTGVTGKLLTDIADLGRFNMDFGRSTLLDVNSNPQTADVSIENDNRRASMGLVSHRPVVGNLSHAWALGGRVVDNESVNRGTTFDRKAIGGVASSRWYYSDDLTTVVARFGYDRETGDRLVRGIRADALAVRDTIGATVRVEERSVFRLEASLDRANFVEERLDLRRNSFGVVDTLSVPVGQALVGEEREQRSQDKGDLYAHIFDYYGFDIESIASHSFRETQYSFSREGIVHSSSSSWDNRLSYDYSDGGRIKLEEEFSSQWDDRRSLDDQEFRGRATRRNAKLKISIEQRVSATSRLTLNMQQELSQTIFENEQDPNNRDRLVERIEGILDSDPMPTLNTRVSAILRRADEINISAERSGDNREDRLFEVRGSYGWTPASRLELTQIYQMQIVFKDFHSSNSRDQFNKQGQVNSRLRFGRPTGPGAQSNSNVASKTPTIEVRYDVDFRSAGNRVGGDDVLGRSYSTINRRFDHVVGSEIVIPVGVFSLRVDAERGFFFDRNIARDTVREERDGRLMMGLKGNKSLRKGLIALNLDVSRILAYGPRVRDTNRDYWTANSSIKVVF